ncbi:hypothetical protein ABER23_08600 [Paenibacillus lautus]|uniref:hypothetical protein n=1 Tax=Paenibacillus lautus TaxID=1401 RepID=UPI003D280597
MSTLQPKAQQMIHNALAPLIRKGCKIENIKFVVSPDAPISQHQWIDTPFGELRVEPYNHVPKGVAYMIEHPTRKESGFAWVSRRDGKTS